MVLLTGFILAFVKYEQVWEMIVPLWSHTSVILWKADLHIFVTTGFENRTHGYECLFLGTLDVCVSSVMIEELYGGLYTLCCSYQIININMSSVVLCGALCHLFCNGGWNGAALSKSSSHMAFAPFAAESHTSECILGSLNLPKYT